MSDLINETHELEQKYIQLQNVYENCCKDNENNKSKKLK